VTAFAVIAVLISSLPFHDRSGPARATAARPVGAGPKKTPPRKPAAIPLSDGRTPLRRPAAPVGPDGRAKQAHGQSARQGAGAGPHTAALAAKPSAQPRPHGYYIPQPGAVRVFHHRIVAPPALAGETGAGADVRISAAATRPGGFAGPQLPKAAGKHTPAAGTDRTGSGHGTAGAHTMTLAQTPIALSATAPRNAPASVPASAAATAPGAPTAVTGLPRQSGATLTWTAPVSNGGSAITAYKITAAPGGATATVGAVTTGSIYGLTNGTAYTFTVAAVNAAGTGAASTPSAAITPQWAGIPGPVSGLQVTPGNGQVTASWTLPTADGGADLTETVLLISLQGSDDSLSYVTVNVPGTTATLTGLDDGTAYTVSAYTENRAYLTSDEVTSAAVTPVAGPAPAPPTHVTAAPGTAQATVSWTGSSDDGGSAITGYKVTAYDSSNAPAGTPVTVAAGTTTATVAGLANGSYYTFGVAALNAAGASPERFSAQVVPAGPPGAPTGLVAYPANHGLFATWTDPDDTGGSAITSYTVTLTGPGGTTQSKTVPGGGALFTGLANGSSYTFKVKAANAVVAGPLSAASAAASPQEQAQRPVGPPRSAPQATGPDPSLRYTEYRYNAVISGNGRYVFYFSDVYVTYPDGGVYGDTAFEWTRYDLTTGESLPVWTDPNWEVGTGETGSGWSSYDGSVFASMVFETGGIYVWHADTGDITLANANAAGDPTAGATSWGALSADGRYLTFTVFHDEDMAQHSTCQDGSGVGTNGGPIVPDSGSLYRFDTTTNTLSRIQLQMSVANVTVTCILPDSNSGTVAISGDGSRIAWFANFSVAYPSGTTSTEYEQMLSTDVSGGGSAVTTWVSPLQNDYSWNPFWDSITMSDDGRTVVSVLDHAESTGDFSETFVTVDPSQPNAAPVAFANAASAGPYVLSNDGRKLSLLIKTGDFIGPDTQTGVIDVASGQLTVASQVNGELATPSGEQQSIAVDGTGGKVVIDSNSANLTGRTDCDGSQWGTAGCPANITVVNLADGTVGVIPDQSVGCSCSSSLAVPTALQNFVGDPVNTATGAYTESVDDASLPGTGLTFDFLRSYDSSRATVASLMGPGWSEPYGMSLAVSGSNATVTAENGAKSSFVKQGDGSFRAPPGVGSVLAAAGSGYTLTLPDSQVDTFDASGLLTRMADREGRGLTFGYSGGKLATATDSSGRVVGFGHDPATGNISAVTLPGGVTVSYGYDTAGRLSTVTDADGATVYGYDTVGRLTTVTDPAGHIVVHNVYDAATGRVSRQDEAGGAKPAVVWDAADETATTTDTDGRKSVDYYSANVLVAHADEDGGLTSYGYDARLDLTSVTDPEGNTTRMTYDAAGDMLSRTAPAPVSTTDSWTYDAKRNVKTHTDARGKTTKYGYDTANRLSIVTDPAGGVTTYTYTTAGQVETVTDPAGGVTTNTYDAAGNLKTKKDPTGGVTSYTYDAAGRTLTQTDPRGNVTGANAADFTTTYTYDGVGRVATVTDPLGHTTKNTYDTSGRLFEVTDPYGHTTTYGYDDLGRQTSTKDPDGHTTTTDYDPQGEAVAVTDADGSKTTYSYDPAGRLKTVTSPQGNAEGADHAAYTTTYTYDADGRQISVRDPLGDTTDTAYDAAGRPVASSDPMGGVTTTAYDADGDVLSVTDPDGGTASRTYDDAGRVASSTDQVGRTTSYTYDHDGNVLTETSPMGEVTSHTYDHADRLLTTTDPRGNAGGAKPADFTTTYAYDPAGELHTVTDPLGRTTTYGYDGAGQQTTVEDPLGHTTTTAYDDDGRTTGVTDPDGRTTTTAYDPAGNVLNTVDPLGDTTSYTYDDAGRQKSVTTPRGNAAGANADDYTTGYGYDADGNRTTVTDPLGHTTTTGYDADERPTTGTDPLGHTTTTGYDADGRAVSVTDPTGAVVASGYDGSGHLTTSTDALGKETLFTYDKAGHRLTATTPMGETTTTTYDADGRTHTVVDPRGNAAGADTADFTTTYGYDAAGNATTVTDALGHTTTTAYDADGRPTTVTDPEGHSTVTAYEEAGRVASVTDALQHATGYTYDPAGHLLTRTDANSHTTTYGYDDAGQLTSVKDPLGRTVSYGYDPDGERDTITDARGVVTTAAFDPRGLVASLHYTDATPPVSYGYDDAGRRTSVTDGTGARSLTYDDAGRVLTATVGGHSDQQFGYAYDPAGHVTGRTYPDGEHTGYTYDDDGRTATQTADGAAVGYGYDAAGDLTTTTLPAANGFTESRGYDDAGRLTSVKSSKGGSTLSSFQAVLDKDGRPVELDSVRGGAAQAPQTFGYDDAGRLTSWCTSAASTTGCPAGSAQVGYTYDNAGNRATMAKGGKTTAYTYDAADELTTAVTGVARQNYKYDADGNYTGNGSSASSITYDANDHPISAVQAGTSYAFTNDDQGDRVTTASGGATVLTETWDTNGDQAHLATETGANGALMGDFHTDPLGLPLSEHTASGTDYDHHDLLGSVTDLTDSTGVPQIAYSYDPFGVRTATPVSGVTAPANPFGYTGGLDDPVLTGEQDLGARVYDSTTGRFTSQDPIGLRIDDPYVSAYVYADDGPTYKTDPTGTSSRPAPGNGWWSPGGDPQHDFALEMAYEQEVAKYGVDNVYADFPGGNGVTDGRTFTVPAYWTDNAEPDLIARVPTAKGIGYQVWDVKPATVYGRSYRESVNKLTGYVKGLASLVGPVVTKGDPIMPEARLYPEDVNGAEGVMVIFNGAQWSTFGLPEAKPKGRYTDTDIAPLSDTKGLIYYRLTRFGDRQGQDARSKALFELVGEGAYAQLQQMLVCVPVGMPAHQRDPLRIIGTTGGADVSSLASRTALTAFAPGPINAVDPDPFPAPQVQTYSYSTTSVSDWDGPGWGSVKSFLVSATVDALSADFPEARVVTELPSVAGTLTRDLFRLAA
jgi:RHS repeat-associated protein